MLTESSQSSGILRMEQITISGSFFRTARPRDEPHVCIEGPDDVIRDLKTVSPTIDLFTFAQALGDRVPRYTFHLEPELVAGLPLTTYDKWFKQGIDFKVRNKVRKAQKLGVELKPAELSDEFIRGVMGIYNESPLIQGRRNWHYGKGFDAMKRTLSTFPERSAFVGAYLGDELVGFTKLFYGDSVASLIHIIAKTAHRDKAPTNALLAKAIEMSAAHKSSHLVFGSWSRRGLGVFKSSHGFEPLEIPRYYVPLTLKGTLMLKLGLHRSVRDNLPEAWVDSLVTLRNRWNSLRYRAAKA
jgi:hypothetical protein